MLLPFGFVQLVPWFHTIHICHSVGHARICIKVCSAYHAQVEILGGYGALKHASTHPLHQAILHLHSLFRTTMPPSQDMCINMVARLFHAPLSEGQQAVGTSTLGSSEAIMLAGKGGGRGREQ